MKSEKIIRFLNSINITEEEQDSYDLEFLNIQKSSDGCFCYFFLKDTPWTYNLLDNFLIKIHELSYSCHPYFEYKRYFNDDELKAFIDEFTFNRIFDTLEYSVHSNSEILITFNTKEDYEIFSNIKDEFVSLFKFMGVKTPLNITFKANNDLKTEEKTELLDKKEKEFQDLVVKTEEDIKFRTENAITERNNYLNRRKIYKTVNEYKEIKVQDITKDDDAVCFVGKAVGIEDPKDLASGQKSYRFTVGSFEGAISVYLTSNDKDLLREDCDLIKEDTNIEIKGRVGKSNSNIYVQCHYFKILEPDPLREDTCEEKRVELHLHTKMSEMDGVGDVDDYFKLAKHMGHKALAITDHGVLQAIPQTQSASAKTGVKAIYGSELYVLEDYLIGAYCPTEDKIKDLTYVVFDLESTGLNIRKDRITEIGAVKLRGGMIIDRYDELINPEMKISQFIEEKTKITNEMVKDKRTIKEALPDFFKFVGDAILVAHNAPFDYPMINEASLRELGKEYIHPVIDTLKIARYLFPGSRGFSLGDVCKRFDIEYDANAAHRADYDAQVLCSCWTPMKDLLVNKLDNPTLKDLSMLAYPQEIYKSLKSFNSFHLCVLAKNREGLKDLYKLVSEGLCNSVGAVPFTHRHLIDQYRKNLLVGSACFNGEVFQSAIRKNLKELRKAISYYDYIEIQPLENYSFLINTGELRNEEELKDALNIIIQTAEEMGKMICATGDCHYVNPNQKVYRDVIISNQAVGGIFHPLNYSRRRNGEVFFENPDQHYLSTNEMLDAFKWLNNDEKAHEYVIKSTNLIADMCEEMIPIPLNKLFTPKIENCEQLLTDLCYENAHADYGEVLSEYIENRLKAELHGIISNGYAVTYYIAHKLVKLTNERGYIVGSRGSVGSSFAAYCARITEVNPLPPHYRCPKCKHVEFHNKKDGVTSGFDLEDKLCPECGTKLIKDGQNIPFETFLGFKAEKVPDIDLNFPADFQSTAHLFTKDLLGEDKVFRAGTVSTVKDKTAFGYVRKYYESFLHQDPNKVKTADIAFLAAGCLKIKRTTGQHPGGIVVVPREYDIYDFTPVQYPANDTTAAWKTTHFDFHAIHDTILKLDMLGHVDPQALKMMSDLSGVNIADIGLDDRNIISLFSTNKVLKLQHKYIKDDIGTTGIPEMGTNFVKQLIRDAKPKSFSDLVIISGLSHGTNVWTNNAQDLISQGIADIRGVIGCRDDIMTYLIGQGLDNSKAFTIMETVRKGKRLNDEQIKDMEEHGVPEFYINSCKKIRYLFPKGHACAYVIMALRVAYFKIYYPLEYYATYFTLRCDQYDLETMMGGIDAIYKKLEEFKERNESRNPELALSKTEEDLQETLVSCLEYAERGYIFTNVDINRSDSTKFVIDKDRNGLIPPFKVLPSIGENGGNSVLEARKEKSFDSIKDFENRSKLPKKVIQYLKNNGALKGLKESDEETLFDLSMF